jgi:hypothetical protein
VKIKALLANCGKSCDFIRQANVHQGKSRIREGAIPFPAPTGYAAST